MQPFFISPACPSFDEKPKPPANAMSQAAKLVAEFKAGNRMTAAQANAMLGTTEGARRIRDARRLLAMDGLELKRRKVDGANYSEYYL